MPLTAGDVTALLAVTADWRCTDRGELAKAMQVPKPPPVIAGQGQLFDLGAPA